MKVYNLSCEHDHRFEGWFSSEEDFKRQSDGQSIECPMCDSHIIRRLPSAPRLSLSAMQDASPPVDATLAVQTKLVALMRRIVENTEDVGERFAEEARRIHYNETPERAIRGVATAQECEALMDEGVDILALPIPAPLKQPLQ